MRSTVHLRVGRLLATLLVATLAGCADPYERDAAERRGAERATPTASPTPPADAPASPQDSAPAPATGGADDRRPTPDGALRAFGERWSNWSWRNAEGQQRRLATLATGSFREYLLSQAEQPVDTLALERTKPAIEGSVEAIAFTSPAGRRRSAAVVIREQELTDGEPRPDGLHYAVYLAEAARVQGGWAVSRWEGQP